MPSREVKLCGQPLPVDVLGEVDTFAPTVMLRIATLVDALAGRKRCWIWRGCCGICSSCRFPIVCIISFCREIFTCCEVSCGCSCCEVSCGEVCPCTGGPACGEVSCCGCSCGEVCPCTGGPSCGEVSPCTG